MGDKFDDNAADATNGARLISTYTMPNGLVASTTLSDAHLIINCAYSGKAKPACRLIFCNSPALPFLLTVDPQQLQASTFSSRHDGVLTQASMLQDGYQIFVHHDEEKTVALDIKSPHAEPLMSTRINKNGLFVQVYDRNGRGALTGEDCRYYDAAGHGMTPEEFWQQNPQEAQAGRFILKMHQN